MQLKRWEQEYAELNNLPSSVKLTPSGAVRRFVEEYNGSRESALDIGSGKGRNSIYLAKSGFQKVVGVEMVQGAIDFANKQVNIENLADKIEFINTNVGNTLPFKDESFDVIFDMMVMHLLNKEERENYIKEIQRLLKKGGYFVIHTISANSPSLQKLLKESPSEEENSYIIPESGMIEKAFTSQELKEMFTPLSVIKLDEFIDKTPAFGSEFEVAYFSGVFMK